MTEEEAEMLGHDAAIENGIMNILDETFYTDTTLADKIKQSANRTKADFPNSCYIPVKSEVIDQILRALRERDQAVEALRQYGTHGAGCSGYNDECSCGLAETLASIEGTGHE